MSVSAQAVGVGWDTDVLYEQRLQESQPRTRIFRGNNALNEAIEYGTKGMKWGVRKRKEKKGLGRRGRKEVEAKLASSPVVDSDELGGGVSETFLVKLKDGSKAVWKPDSGENSDVRDTIPAGNQSGREAAAWEVAKIVGLDDLVVPAVVRGLQVGEKIGSETGSETGEKGAMLEFVDGKTAHAAPDAFDGKEDLARAAVFDFVIGNTDRHKGNWLVKEGKLRLIDHGLAFPVTPKDRGRVEIHSQFMGMAAAKNIPLTEDDVRPFFSRKNRTSRALKALGLGKPEIRAVRRRMKYLKEAVKHPNPWKSMHERFGGGFLRKPNYQSPKPGSHPWWISKSSRRTPTS